VSVARDALVLALVRAAGALRAAGVPFALAGGCAVYARGGPVSEHDLDLVVREADVRAAVRALVGVGMCEVDVPEDWLAKVRDGGVEVDLLFRPNERPVTDETLDAAEPMLVGSAQVPVQRATDVLIGKLLVLTPHRCDFAELLAIVRAVREQIEWPRVRRETACSPYAEAFLVLVERLRLADTAGGPQRWERSA
jgi:hypothetical protein